MKRSSQIPPPIETDAAFAAAWERHLGARPPKKFVAHPLYPLRDLKRDARTILKGAVKFLHDYGYYPHGKELALALEADYAGLVHITMTLTEMGLMLRKQVLSSARSQTTALTVTPRGWAALGLKEIEPWIRRPVRLLDRVAHKVTIDLADIETARQQLAARDAEVAEKRLHINDAKWPKSNDPRYRPLPTD